MRRRPWRRRRVVLLASYTCPRCRLVSYHPVDVEQGYCAACHDWTHGMTPLRARQLDDEIARHGITDPRPAP